MHHKFPPLSNGALILPCPCPPWAGPQRPFSSWRMPRAAIDALHYVLRANYGKNRASMNRSKLVQPVTAHPCHLGARRPLTRLMPRPPPWGFKLVVTSVDHDNKYCIISKSWLGPFHTGILVHWIPLQFPTEHLSTPVFPGHNLNMTISYIGQL